MKSILIADDEYDIALALELVLTEEGYQVTTAANGKEALTRMSESRPDLVILDLMMPVLTGLEALEQIKANPDWNSTPVVLMSAVHPKGRKEDYHWSAFVRKPFDINTMLRLIDRLLRESDQPSSL